MRHISNSGDLASQPKIFYIGLDCIFFSRQQIPTLIVNLAAETETDSPFIEADSPFCWTPSIDIFSVFDSVRGDSFIWKFSRDEKSSRLLSLSDFYRCSCELILKDDRKKSGWLTLFLKFGFDSTSFYFLVSSSRLLFLLDFILTHKNIF